MHQASSGADLKSAHRFFQEPEQPVQQDLYVQAGGDALFCLRIPSCCTAEDHLLKVSQFAS